MTRNPVRTNVLIRRFGGFWSFGSPGLFQGSSRQRPYGTKPDQRRVSGPAAAADGGTGGRAPVAFGLITSTRNLGRTGPIGLSLVEDALDYTAAQCQPLEVRSEASVFEIAGLEDWVELVRRYPLPVPDSRRHDWWRATGYDLEWAIPDYLAIAEDFDAVHLTVAGYLSTAGRSLAVGAAATVLAGWTPTRPGG